MHTSPPRHKPPKRSGVSRSAAAAPTLTPLLLDQQYLEDHKHAVVQHHQQQLSNRRSVAPPPKTRGRGSRRGGFGGGVRNGIGGAAKGSAKGAKGHHQQPAASPSQASRRSLPSVKIVKSGYLHQLQNKWKRRWFVLKNGCLFYYKSEDSDDHNLLGVLSGLQEGGRIVKDPVVTGDLLLRPFREEDKVCFECKKSFGLFDRRHFCRNCDYPFCAKCTSSTIALPHRGFFAPVRVCDNCFEHLHSDAGRHKRQSDDEMRLTLEKSPRVTRKQLPGGISEELVFVVATKERELWLFADSFAEKAEWCAAIKSVMKQSPVVIKKPEKQNMWEIDFSQLTNLAKVAAGAYGDIFRGRLWGTDVAVKMLRVRDSDNNDVLTDLKKEIAILSTLRHPNIILYIGACTKPPNVCIVTEWCDNGSLHDYLKDPNTHLDTKKTLQYAMGIAQGLNYLHSLDGKIIHRDIKSHNVLLDKNLQVKIADFGLSHKIATGGGDRQRAPSSSPSVHQRSNGGGGGGSNPRSSAPTTVRRRSSVPENSLTYRSQTQNGAIPRIFSSPDMDFRDGELDDQMTLRDFFHDGGNGGNYTPTRSRSRHTHRRRSSYDRGSGARLMSDMSMPRGHYGIYGTPQWMSPELMEGQAYNQKIDVYAYGIVLTELVARQVPFKDQYPIKTYMDVCELVLDEGARPTVPDWCTTLLTPLIDQCLDRDPSRRPHFTEVILKLTELNSMTEDIMFLAYDVPRLLETLRHSKPLYQARAAAEIAELGSRQVSPFVNIDDDYFRAFLQELTSLIPTEWNHMNAQANKAIRTLLATSNPVKQIEWREFVCEEGGIISLMNLLCSDASRVSKEEASKVLSQMSQLLVRDQMIFAGVQPEAMTILEDLLNSEIDAIDARIAHDQQRVAEKQALSKTLRITLQLTDAKRDDDSLHENDNTAHEEYEEQHERESFSDREVEDEEDHEREKDRERDEDREREEELRSLSRHRAHSISITTHTHTNGLRPPAHAPPRLDGGGIPRRHSSANSTSPVFAAEAVPSKGAGAPAAKRASPSPSPPDISLVHPSASASHSKFNSPRAAPFSDGALDLPPLPPGAPPSLSHESIKREKKEKNTLSRESTRSRLRRFRPLSIRRTKTVADEHTSSSRQNHRRIGSDDILDSQHRSKRSKNTTSPPRSQPRPRGSKRSSRTTATSSSHHNHNYTSPQQQQTFNPHHPHSHRRHAHQQQNGSYVHTHVPQARASNTQQAFDVPTTSPSTTDMASVTSRSTTPAVHNNGLHRHVSPTSATTYATTASDGPPPPGIGVGGLGLAHTAALIGAQRRSKTMPREQEEPLPIITDVTQHFRDWCGAPQTYHGYCWSYDPSAEEQWRQVYLFLFGSELRVYESSQSDPEDPITVFYMRSSSGMPHRVFTGPMHDKEWCFALEAEEASFCMCARNRHEMQTWANKINPGSGIKANVSLLDSYPHGVAEAKLQEENEMKLLRELPIIERLPEPFFALQGRVKHHGYLLIRRGQRMLERENCWVPMFFVLIGEELRAYLSVEGEPNTPFLTIQLYSRDGIPVRVRVVGDKNHRGGVSRSRGNSTSDQNDEASFLVDNVILRAGTAQERDVWVAKLSRVTGAKLSLRDLHAGVAGVAATQRQMANLSPFFTSTAAHQRHGVGHQAALAREESVDARSHHGGGNNPSPYNLLTGAGGGMSGLTGAQASYYQYAASSIMGDAHGTGGDGDAMPISDFDLALLEKIARDSRRGREVNFKSTETVITFDPKVLDRRFVAVFGRATHHGYLMKRSRVVRNWKLRYFYFVGNQLHYYRRHTDDPRSSLGVIYTHTNSGNPFKINILKSHRLGFQIENPSRKWLLCAQNEKSFHEWMKAFSSGLNLPSLGKDLRR